MFHRIISAAPLEGYKLLIHFANGTAKEYDMAPLCDQMEAFQDLKCVHGLFEQAKADPGGYGVSWNDEIDIDCEELWENGITVSTPFDGLMSFSDASKIWSLEDSTLRKAVRYHRLVNGVDVLKFGKQWVVTKDAMVREYGDADDMAAIRAARAEYVNGETVSHDEIDWS